MGNGLGPARDPNVPDYAYTSKPLVAAYKGAKGGTKVANLFLGEWTKITDSKIPDEGRVKVHFRGGDGYVEVKDLSRNRFLEIFFIDVGQGDSILIQTPDDRRVLIDGGQGEEALEFLANKYRLNDEADPHFIDFDAVVATHCDADHSQGLVPILTHPRIAVKRVYHNGLFRKADATRDPGRITEGRVFDLADRPAANDKALTPMMKRLLAAGDTAGKNLPKALAAMSAQPRWKGRVEPPPEGFVFRRIDAKDRFLPPFDDKHPSLRIEVLWPRACGTAQDLSYAHYGDAGKTVNGNSVVLRIRHGNFGILLTGDLNEKSMADMLKTYAPDSNGVSQTLDADVYKAAHHGSQHFDVRFLKAVRANAAVISSGDDRQDAFGHPRAVLLGTVTRYSKVERPAVFSTEMAACFSPLSKTEAKEVKAGKLRLYERSIQGIVHLRSDGQQLYLGTVHGLRSPDDPLKNVLWKWDVWPDPGAAPED